MAINHLAHFALTLELAPLLRKSAASSPIGARVVSVVSMLHIFAKLHADGPILVPQGECGLLAYANSKCAQILFTRLLRQRLQHEAVHCFAVHPGEVLTDIARDIPAWLFRAQAKIGPLIFFDAWEGATCARLLPRAQLCGLSVLASAHYKHTQRLSCWRRDASHAGDVARARGACVLYSGKLSVCRHVALTVLCH